MFFCEIIIIFIKYTYRSPLYFHTRMNIQYTINNNDIIASVNSDFIQFGKENSGDFFVPEAWIGTKILSCIDGDNTRMFHGLLLQKVRISRKTITYRYRCDAPGLARFMLMHIIPENNAVRYENIIEDEVPINKVLFKTNNSSGFSRCSLCNRFKIGYSQWLDPAYQLPENKLFEWNVSYEVCLDCRQRVGR